MNLPGAAATLAMPAATFLDGRGNLPGVFVLATRAVGHLAQRRRQADARAGHLLGRSPTWRTSWAMVPSIALKAGRRLADLVPPRHLEAPGEIARPAAISARLAFISGERPRRSAARRTPQRRSAAATPTSAPRSFPHEGDRPAGIHLVEGHLHADYQPQRRARRNLDGRRCSSAQVVLGRQRRRDDPQVFAGGRIALDPQHRCDSRGPPARRRRAAGRPVARA